MSSCTAKTQQPTEPSCKTPSDSSQSTQAMDGSSSHCRPPKPPSTHPKRAPGKSSTSCATTSKPRSHLSKRKVSTAQTCRKLVGAPSPRSRSPAVARLASTNQNIPSQFHQPDRLTRNTTAKLAKHYVQIRHHHSENAPAHPLPDPLPLARPRIHHARASRQLRRPHQLHHPLHRRLDALSPLRLPRHHAHPPPHTEDRLAHPLPSPPRSLRLLLRNPPSSDLHLPLLRIRHHHRPHRPARRTPRRNHYPVEAHLAPHGRRRPQAPFHPGRPPRVADPPLSSRHLTRLHHASDGRKKLATPPSSRLRGRDPRHHSLLVDGQERQLRPLEGHRRPHHPPVRPYPVRHPKTPTHPTHPQTNRSQTTLTTSPTHRHPERHDSQLHRESCSRRACPELAEGTPDTIRRPSAFRTFSTTDIQSAGPILEKHLVLQTSNHNPNPTNHLQKSPSKTPAKSLVKSQNDLNPSNEKGSRVTFSPSLVAIIK